MKKEENHSSISSMRQKKYFILPPLTLWSIHSGACMRKLCKYHCSAKRSKNLRSNEPILIILVSRKHDKKEIWFLLNNFFDMGHTCKLFSRLFWSSKEPDYYTGKFVNSNRFFETDFVYAWFALNYMYRCVCCSFH